jgi:hypothetical protein
MGTIDPSVKDEAISLLAVQPGFLVAFGPRDGLRLARARRPDIALMRF